MDKNNILNIDNTYLNLQQNMYSFIEPRSETKSKIVILNKELLDTLAIDEHFFSSEDGMKFLAGSSEEFGPLYAQAYAGHQFGYFTKLGDGRAIMLGEHVTPTNERFDLHAKGAGRTPYSRGGDGKATLYSMLREYLISEAIYHLGIPTTRSLAVLDTNEWINRKGEEKGGMVVRVAQSHIRVGTFEYAKAFGSNDLVKELADYTINRHFHDISNAKNKYVAFFERVIERQASLIAKWQSVGFIHGVMNTDNMLVSGESIDYGPCAFMDYYRPDQVYSSIDQTGRYAFNRQPYIGSWNLSKFAETLLHLFSDNQEEAVSIANKTLQTFGEKFNQYWLSYMGLKLGIEDAKEEERDVIEELLSLMEKYKLDYTNTFVHLTQNQFEKISFYQTEEWNVWFQKWTRALGYRQMDVSRRIDIMKKANPVIIPRNELVEEALLKASKLNDYSLFNQLLLKLQDPYNYLTLHQDEFLSPSDFDEEYVTYCGT